MVHFAFVCLNNSFLFKNEKGKNTQEIFHLKLFCYLEYFQKIAAVYLVLLFKYQHVSYSNLISRVFFFHSLHSKALSLGIFFYMNWDLL